MSVVRTERTVKRLDISSVMLVFSEQTCRFGGRPASSWLAPYLDGQLTSAAALFPSHLVGQIPLPLVCARPIASLRETQVGNPFEHTGV